MTGCSSPPFLHTHLPSPFALPTLLARGPLVVHVLLSRGHPVVTQGSCVASGFVAFRAGINPNSLAGSYGVARFRDSKSIVLKDHVAVITVAVRGRYADVGVKADVTGRGRQRRRRLKWWPRPSSAKPSSWRVARTGKRSCTPSCSSSSHPARVRF